MTERNYARKYLRISPNYPVYAELAIVQVGMRQVKSSTANVRILDISPGGLKFISSLNMPVDMPVQLEMHFRVVDQDFRLTGQIVYKSSSEVMQYEYGFRFNEADETLRACLKKLFNNMSIKVKRHIVILRLN